MLGGCASPGEPIERKPPVAQAIGDLAAQQVGNSAELTFTMPQQTTGGRPLTQPIAVEIFRNFVAPAAARTAGPPATLLVTIPPAMVSNYVTQGRFRYTDELRAEDFEQHPASLLVYAVRTRASAKKESAASNVATVRVYPLPGPIDDLKAEVTHTGIQLTWTPPTKTPVGTAPPIATYRIYRALLPQAATAQPAGNPPAGANAQNAPLTKIGETQTPAFLDTQMQFGNTYVYSVRSVVQTEGQQLESGDSNRVTILARDTFPPAAPEGLIVAFVPAQSAELAHLELSWNISSETDLAGYNVYRSEQSGVQGTRINSELLPTPAFRDMNAVPGRTYYYSVTAVDRSGNESTPSAAVSGEVLAENQPAR
ncbi:MAG TPA: hypothetical protein VG322_16200 [Candidatus Acidoferrales bacterium]|jgi:hypothetical protein|nr:hypothetical protein [Candidatus Acidoferrales bacterium]